MENREKNITQLLERFKNGKTRFHMDATFNQVVNHLSRGADPIDIIDQLLTANENLHAQLQETIRSQGIRKIIVSPEEFEGIKKNIQNQ